jgi:serine protease Do
MMQSQRILSIGLTLWTLAVLPHTVSAETLVLQDGQTLDAEVVKSDDRVVIVDLGFDLLRIPRSSIRLIQADPCEAAVAVESDANDSAAGTSHQAGMYYTANLEPTTIERNVDRFAEAVVMVTSPGGQGSGFILNEKGYLITNFHVIEGETLIKVTVFHKTPSGFEQQGQRMLFGKSLLLRRRWRSVFQREGLLFESLMAGEVPAGEEVA